MKRGCVACSCPDELARARQSAKWTRSRAQRFVAAARKKDWRAPRTGGLADGQRVSCLPASAVAQGMLVELEHTSDPWKAMRIAMDHLVESRGYYPALAKMERRLEHNPRGRQRATGGVRREPRSTYELVVINPKPRQWPERPDNAQRDALSMALRNTSSDLAGAIRDWPDKQAKKGKALAKKLVMYANQAKPLGEIMDRKPVINVANAIDAWREAEDLMDSALTGFSGPVKWQVGGPLRYMTGEAVEDWRGDRGTIIALQKEEERGRPNRVVVDWNKWGRQVHHPVELDRPGKAKRRGSKKRRPKKKPPPRAGVKPRPPEPPKPRKAKRKPPPKLSERTWATEHRAGPEIREGYAHLVWGPDDPPRSERPKKGGREDVSPHLTLKKKKPEVYAKQIMRLMRDGKPRTFNEMGVTLWDKNASILYQGPVDEALWSLVEKGELEHSLEAPILFRKRTKESFVPKGRRLDERTAKPKAKPAPKPKPRPKPPARPSPVGAWKSVAAKKKPKPAKKKRKAAPKAKKQDVLSAWRKARGK